MMSYFGFGLIEMVEKVSAPVSEEESRLHYNYMVKVYRLMGLAFSSKRQLMETFGRQIEQVHAGTSPDLEKHARNILLLGEMVNVTSDYENIAAKLPEHTRVVFKTIYTRVRPSLFKRTAARLFGPYIVPKAVGQPREAVPVQE